MIKSQIDNQQLGIKEVHKINSNIVSFLPLEISIEEDGGSYSSAIVKDKVGKSLSDEASEVPEVLKDKAIFITTRISNKLTGKDFSKEILDVKQQVERLIKQATNTENLCQAYMGWSPYW